MSAPIYDSPNMSLNQLIASKASGGLPLTCQSMTYGTTSAAPSELPAVDQLKVFFKDDGMMYQLDSSGTESVVNGGPATSEKSINFLPTMSIVGGGGGTFTIDNDSARVCNFVVEDENWVSVEWQFNFTKSGGTSAGVPSLDLPPGAPNATQQTNAIVGMANGVVSDGTIMAVCFHGPAQSVQFMDNHHAGNQEVLNMTNYLGSGGMRVSTRYWYGDPAP